MKMIIYCLALVCISCNMPKKQNDFEKRQSRLYIFSTSNYCVEIDWYFYSKIGGFSNSIIEFRRRDTKDTVTLESYYLSDIQIADNALKIQLWSNDTAGIDILQIPCFVHVEIDTSGDQNKNGIDARITRIIEAGVDYTKPHNFNSRSH